MMTNDRCSISRADALHVFWIVGIGSVLLDLDHLWKVLGLEAPISFTYFAGRDFHTPLIFIITGCFFGIVFTAYALRQDEFRRFVDISGTRAERYLSSLHTYVRRFDSCFDMRRSDTLLVSGSGGHLKRALVLREYFENATVIIPYESEVSKYKVKENYIRVISPRYRAKSSRIMTVFRTLWLFLHSIVIVSMMRPKLVISTGSGLSLPILLIAKFFRVKTVYIESPSRVHEPSITGRLMLSKTDRWIALWKTLAEKYGVSYGGML